MSELNLLPCPFCGVALQGEIDDGARFHTHPKSDCWFSEWEFDQINIKQWNRRTAPVGEVELPAQSIDTPEFRALLRAHAKASEERFSRGDQKAAQAERAARDSIIAYIDGRAAGAAQATDPFAAQRFLNWNRQQDKPPVAIGKELGVARKVLEFAAAPTPMNSGKEEA